jgi:hypothetical protein
MSGFIDAVAARANVESDTVEAVLADRGVREWLPGPPPARLRIRQIRFGGFKDPHADPPAEPFEFCWDVPDGVSALASAGNFAGKTSAIEMVRWLLSGRSEVDKWVFERVAEATLQFTLDRSLSSPVRRSAFEISESTPRCGSAC